jgi:hypothetical protein
MRAERGGTGEPAQHRSLSGHGSFTTDVEPRDGVLRYDERQPGGIAVHLDHQGVHLPAHQRTGHLIAEARGIESDSHAGGEARRLLRACGRTGYEEG